MEKHEREALAAKFERHADEEGKILGEYRSFAESLRGGPAAFLIDLILTEEELHHLLLKNTAKWLRQPPTSQGPAAPAGVTGALARRTKQLQEHEKETIDSCKSLQKTLSGTDSDLLSSVLDVLVLDSEKHHRLLLAVEKILSGLR